MYPDGHHCCEGLGKHSAREPTESKVFCQWGQHWVCPDLIYREYRVSFHSDLIRICRPCWEHGRAL